MTAKAGRPTVRSDALAKRICTLLMEGKSLQSIVKRKGMPAMPTVLAWLRDDPAFSTQYARARAVQVEVVADGLMDLADSARGMASEGVQAVRLAVDTRKWVLSKLLPKRYGDRVEQRPQSIALPPDLSTPANIAAAAEAIMRAACAGEISTGGAQALAGVLELRRRAIETEDLDRRLKALEAALVPART